MCDQDISKNEIKTARETDCWCCYAIGRRLMSPWPCPLDNRVRDFNGLANPLPCLSVSPSVGGRRIQGTHGGKNRGRVVWLRYGRSLGLFSLCLSLSLSLFIEETATCGLSSRGQGGCRLPCHVPERWKPAPCADPSVRWYLDFSSDELSALNANRRV